MTQSLVLMSQSAVSSVQGLGVRFDFNGGRWG